MGKVYDALRRAEARRGGQVVASPEAPVRVPEPTEVPAARRHAGLEGPKAKRRRIQSKWLRRLLRWGQIGQPDVNALNKQRVSLLHPDSFAAEQFRSLRARLDNLESARGFRTICVTSALPNEGKTTTAVNLAVVSAMSVGRRILLIDADLRKPGIHRAMNLRPACGLGDVLTHRVSVEQAIVKVDGANLDVLPTRHPMSNPSELLASERMRNLIEEVHGQYDRIILDTPPALALPDAKVLSRYADGVLLVVRADRTPRDDVEATVETLDRDRLLGVVFNGSSVDADRYGYY